MDAADVIDFWFKETEPSQRFKKDAGFDRLIRYRFSEVHRQACAGDLKIWRDTPQGVLAEIIVLDQFSRNIYRDQPQAFAADALALALAKDLVNSDQDKQLSLEQRKFAYMPFMHSESREDHRLAEILYRQPGLEESYRFELRHKEIIDRFGRYPHRNEILGRQSTREELDFLEQPGSSF